DGTDRSRVQERHKSAVPGLGRDSAPAGKIPTMVEYNLHGDHSVTPMVRRFGGWSQVPLAMLEYAKKEGLEGGWEDVLDVVTRHLEAAPGAGRSMRPANGTLYRPRILADQPTYGAPLVPMPLCLAPTNE